MSAREIKQLADKIVKNEKKQAQVHHRDKLDMARITKIIVMSTHSNFWVIILY